MMKWLCVPVLLTFIFSPAKSQQNDTTQYHFRLAATGNLNYTDASNSYLLANEAKFGLKNKKVTYNLMANWLYGVQQHALSNNDFFATTDINKYHDSSRLYTWALANYTSSYSLNIKAQIQTGLGAAYNFLNTDTTWLNVSEGLLYEESNLNTAQPDQNRYHTFRNSLRLSFRFFLGKKFTVSGTNFVQHAFGDGNDYIIRASNSIGLQVNKWISLAASLNYNRYNRTQRQNLLLTYGVIMERFY